MSNISSFIPVPFKYDHIIWSVFSFITIATAFVGGGSIIVAIAATIAAFLIAMVTANARLKYYKVVIPILFVVTLILLLPMTKDILSDMNLGDYVLLPVWLAGISCIGMLSLFVAHKDMDIKHKGIMVYSSVAMMLMLLAVWNLTYAFLLAMAICLTFYVCGIGRKTVIFVTGLIIAQVILLFSIVAFVGKTQTELIGIHEERTGILHRLDAIKERLCEAVQSAEYNNNVLPAVVDTDNISMNFYSHIIHEYGKLFQILPILLIGFVVYITIRKLRHSNSTYARFLGIGTSFVLLVGAVSDVTSAIQLNDIPSSIFVNSAMYGIILCCMRSEECQNSNNSISQTIHSHI